MTKMNGEPVQRALDDNDGRIGYQVVSIESAQSISRACAAALARRGISTVRFNRMDFCGPNFKHKRKKK